MVPPGGTFALEAQITRERERDSTAILFKYNIGRERKRRFHFPQNPPAFAAAALVIVGNSGQNNQIMFLFGKLIKCTRFAGGRRIGGGRVEGKEIIHFLPRLLFPPHA